MVCERAGGTSLKTGARYNPSAGTWTPVTTNGAPVGRNNHTAVWTGNEMIVWGGGNGNALFNNGGLYNPAGDTWTALPTTSAPTGRVYHTMAWAGNQMLIWGGIDGSSIIDSAKLPVKHMPMAPTPGPPHSACASFASARSHCVTGLVSLAANARNSALTQTRWKIAAPSSAAGTAPSRPNSDGM